jgi:hypothetical protein
VERTKRHAPVRDVHPPYPRAVTAPSISAIPKDVTRRARRVDSVDRTPNRGMILKLEDTILAKIDFYLV